MSISEIEAFKNVPTGDKNVSADSDDAIPVDNGNDNAIIHNDIKYFPYTTEFVDDEGNDQHKTFHFRRPQRLHLTTIAKAGKDKVLDSQKEMLIQLALPDERNALRGMLDEFIPLAGSFADEVFKRAGAGSVFAGK